MVSILEIWWEPYPLETALLIGADISTDKPLRDTINFLSNTVDQIINYSNLIEQG